MAYCPVVDTPRSRRAIAVVILVVTGLVVAGMALVVRERFGPLVRIDESVSDAATQVTGSHPELVRLLVAWQESFQPWRVNLVAIGSCALLWWRYRERSRAIRCAATVILVWGLTDALKLSVQRTRPVFVDQWSHATGGSFPSGHAASAVAAFAAVSLACWPVLTARWARVVLSTVGVLCVAATAADRVFIGAHFPSDVLVALVLAVGVVAASFLGWEPGRHPTAIRPASRRHPASAE